MHRYQAHKKNGFTMIEVIVSLLLIGILAVIAAMGLVTITKGYVFARQNNETSLKGQVALAKIVKEISSLRIETDTITVATATSIIYTYIDPLTNTAASHTIDQSGTQVRFDTITLVDNVTGFTLTYFNNAGVPPVPFLLADIRRVDINLQLQGAEDIVSIFADSAKIQESFY